MPAYEPGEEIPIVLECDRDKPKDKQRVFWVKAMSWREQKEFNKFREEIFALNTDEEQVDKAIEVILQRVVRCTNMDNPLTPESLEAIVDYKQIWDLFAAVRYNLTYEEKKS